MEGVGEEMEGVGEEIEGVGVGVAERVCVGCLLPIVGVAVEHGAATDSCGEGALQWGLLFNEVVLTPAAVGSMVVVVEGEG